MDVLSLSLNWTSSIIYIFLTALYKSLIDSKSVGAYTRQHRWPEPTIRLKFVLVDGIHIAEPA